MTETDFRRQVNSMSRPSHRRIRVLSGRESGGTTTVDVEIVATSDAPFLLDGGPHTRIVAFSLRQVAGEWRIIAAPSLWEIG